MESMRRTHAKHAACKPPRLRGAAARALGGVRGGRAPPQLHPRRRRDRPDPVGGEPADPGARRPARRGAVPAPAPGLGAHRGRPRFPAGDDRGADVHRSRQPCAQAGERDPAGGRQHHRRLRRRLADSAADRLRRRSSRRRRPHFHRQQPGQSRARRRRRGRPLSLGRPASGGGDAAVRRERVPGLQRAPAPRRRRRAQGAGRSRRPDPAQDGARRQQPPAGLGPVAARHAAHPAQARRGAAFLLVRPVDPGGGRRPGRGARPSATDRPSAESKAAGRAVCRRRRLAEGLLHAGRGGCGAAPRGRGLHRMAGGGSTRPGFSTPAGSSAASIARIIARATGDLRVLISSSFSRPMPCSAEIEPLRAPTAS